MIGYLKGNLLRKNEETTQWIVDVSGVGYEILVSKNLFDAIDIGKEIEVWVHTHVREDVFQLFGFLNLPDKQLFKLLISMSGLGPKTALSLMGQHASHQLIRFILAKDVASISEAPGVGKKLAARMVVELGSKVEKLAWVEKMPEHEKRISAIAATPEQKVRDDLSSALEHLGYQVSHIKTVLDRLWAGTETPSVPFEELLRMALSELSSRQRASAVEIGAHG